MKLSWKSDSNDSHPPVMIINTESKLQKVENDARYVFLDKAYGINFPIFSLQFSKVNFGNLIISPPFKADSCAKIPTQVMFADCLAFG